MGVRYYDRRTGTYYDEIPEWAMKVSDAPEEYQKEYYNKYGSSITQPNSGEQLDKADTREVEISKADDRVSKQFDSNSWMNFLGTQAIGAGSALGAGYALPWLWSIPGVAQTTTGALNLTGIVHGGKQLLGESGLKKSWNFYKNGDYEGMGYSLFGDAVSGLEMIPGMRAFNITLPGTIDKVVNQFGGRSYVELSRELNKVIKNPTFKTTSFPSPIIRYKLGDVEINDPNLNYRVGDKGIIEDFITTGKVRSIDSEKPSPYFNRGSIWRFKEGDPSQEQLLVTREPLQNIAEAKGGNLLKNAYLQLETRTVPYTFDQLNKSNVTPYIWRNKYGYKRWSDNLQDLSTFKIDNSPFSFYPKNYANNGIIKIGDIQPHNVEFDPKSKELRFFDIDSNWLSK